MADHDFRSNDSTPLTARKCVPCEGGVPTLTAEQVAEYIGDIPEWSATEDVSKLYRSFEFKSFDEAMEFVNKVADVAREEDHHPDMYIYYSKVDLELSTHAIGGLSENDFIVAAKVDAL